MIRHEFSNKLLELFHDELSELRKQDQEKIQALQVKINKLTRTITEKDQEIAQLKAQLKPTRRLSVSSFIKPDHDISPTKEEEFISPARKPQFMVSDRSILATQYSDDDEEVDTSSKKKSPFKRKLSSSQGSIIISPRKSTTSLGPPEKIPRLNATFELDEFSPVKPTQYSSSSSHSSQVHEEVEDSEDEVVEILQFPIISIPKNVTTILQKRKYLLNYYTDRFHNDIEFKINLIRHPINEINWDFADFKANPNYKQSKSLIHNHKIINQKQYNKVKAFYQAANINNDEFNDSFEDKLSQIFDKFASPPGFMNSEFPDTQEQQARRELLKKRQNKRLARRIKECTSVDRGKQIGEFMFVVDILNMYVVSDRWFIK
ncbi:uncharacterized protein SPAPADRAFT_67159 [Spathaspora passalidarum NRRL Y-27907]|uniref:Uncharacterized protein n=1 Tax=Spathaspora passalidarum (strain NRRL Y-27907 / 11-Y1) TaxID=619300 RepID=G3ANN0_SPAPN|nr:uncharacterized protein SPAPADRAFT_67159 [Spathaspora passalidarum NRRL Y-27907]EGW32559.1 hypothetical protein SPAPADRAFT_67159 [Spathaspora passalidarum NRRL Y-27907]